MIKKIMVSLLSISLIAVLTIGSVIPGFALAAVGLSAGERPPKAEKKDPVQLLKTGLCDLSLKMEAGSKASYSSEDGAVTIEVLKSNEDFLASIAADTKMISITDIQDIGKIIEMAKNYLEPVFTGEQTLALGSMLLGDAYIQKTQGKDKILIAKNYDGISITASGEISTGLLKVDIKNTLGVKQCQLNESKATEMKVLPR